MEYLADRLKEPSTWRGLVALITAFGITLSPEQSDAVIAAGLGIIGAIGAFFGDKGKPEAK